MKALILAAGYATRLYPLTKETPKPLLEVAGKSILERLLEKIGVIPEVDHVYIVTNSRFSQVFESWVENYTYDRPVTVIDDGTTSNENRLGAIGDIQYAIEKERIEDDLMILAGDNLFDFELCDFARFFEGTNADVITAYRVKDVSMRRRLGIAELDSSGRVLSFQEKPEEPRSQWAVPALYIYQQETLPLISMTYTKVTTLTHPVGSSLGLSNTNPFLLFALTDAGMTSVLLRVTRKPKQSSPQD